MLGGLVYCFPPFLIVKILAPCGTRLPSPSTKMGAAVGLPYNVRDDLPVTRIESTQKPIKKHIGKLCEVRIEGFFTHARPVLRRPVTGTS